MDWFNIIKSYYDEGFYSVDDCKVFVEKGKITADQYQQITGEVYSAS